MIIVITGGAKNGKSSLAQNMTAALAQDRHFYIATMIPSDDEDRERIRKHVADRAGMGFETIECGVHIPDALEAAGGKGAYLLDSVTALLANEMFPRGSMDLEAAPRVAEELLLFADKADHVVFVFDGLFGDADAFDEITETYRSGLALCQKKLAERCDVFIEMFAGVPVYHKGSETMWKPAAGSDSREGTDDKPLCPCDQKTGGKRIMEVVLGGAYQGKTDYVREKYGFSDSDIYVCTPDAEPDLSKPCLIHAEQYVLYAMRNGLEPAMTFSGNTVLVFDDIFCGVVPVDKETRLWREAAARYMTACAREADVVTRVTAGLPQVLKACDGMTGREGSQDK